VDGSSEDGRRRRRRLGRGIVSTIGEITKRECCSYWASSTSSMEQEWASYTQL
jgi:hypothetical protein